MKIIKIKSSTFKYDIYYYIFYQQNTFMLCDYEFKYSLSAKKHKIDRFMNGEQILLYENF